MGSSPSKPNESIGIVSDTNCDDMADPAFDDAELPPNAIETRETMRQLKLTRLGDSDATFHLNKLHQIFYDIYESKPHKSADAYSQCCRALLSEDMLGVFVKCWDECHKKPDEFFSDVESMTFRNFYLLKCLLWNYCSECKLMDLECYKHEVVIERIMREFTMTQLSASAIRDHPKLINVVEANLKILQNALRQLNQMKDLVRKYNGIERIIAYDKSNVVRLRVYAMTILAYCINEEENSKIVASLGVIDYMVKLFAAAVSSEDHVEPEYLYTVEISVEALTKMASNEANKKAIVEAGVLPYLSKLLHDEKSTAEEHLLGINCIWSLAFDKDNKKKIIQEPDLLQGVDNLRQTTNISDKLKKAIESLMFVLELEQPDQKQVQGDKKHVMISYNWEVQPVMLKLRDYLSSQGINVWIDVDKIHGSILSAMGEAVENSALVVIAMTEVYKNSLPCRTEAEYAFTKAVPVLPLLLQPGYKADGWLGALLGMKLYVDLSSPRWEQKFPDVLKQVRSLANSSVKTNAKASKSKSKTSILKTTVERPLELSDGTSQEIKRIRETLEKILTLKEKESALKTRLLQLQIEKLEDSK